MLLFILLATVLTIICTLILLPALLNRRKLSTTDLQEQNVAIARQRLEDLPEDNENLHTNEAQLELEAALIDDLKGPDYQLDENRRASRLSAIAVVIFVPVVSGLLYLQLGNHRWNSQIEVPTAEEIQNNPNKGIELLLARLEQVLVEQPEDAAGWELAARTYMGTRQFSKAENAYARVHELAGEHPDTLTAWADASLMVNNNVFSGEIAARVQRALELDPQHVSALWLSAMGARSNGNREQALGFLHKLLPLVAGNVEAANETRAVIASLGGEIPNTVPVLSSESEGIPARREVAVTLSLSSEHAAQVSGDDIVFVFATEKDGPPAPLAVVRLRVGDLPTTVILDHTHAMLPGRTIDGPKAIEIRARVAMSGKPTRSAGDIESRLVEVTQMGRSEVALSIDSMIP
ncbi:MAG: c-type cytochrome biogenesis protein CcmI [Acidiferrobacterales bacterium]|nr:c-type cytochrome biogenesis protein CcmI [Acidiferrobacterales bacterium]